MSNDNNDIGSPIPKDDEHAISVSLQTWRSNVGYEEGEDWVLSRMKAGYPRFFIHPIIKRLQDHIISNYGTDKYAEKCHIFPSQKSARLCLEFLKSNAEAAYGAEEQPRVLRLDFRSSVVEGTDVVRPLTVHAVLFPEVLQHVAKSFWQHSGEGISSRRAQYILRHLVQQQTVHQQSEKESRSSGSAADNRKTGPRRYRRVCTASLEASQAKPSAPSVEIASAEKDEDLKEVFIDERYGRYLNQNTAEVAKTALRRRIAGLLGDHTSAPVDSERKMEETNVFLYPCGMSAIFNAHQLLLSVFGPKTSACFGFPYIDTLKVLQKFGPGCHFLGNGDLEDLSKLERMLTAGNEILAVFCEFPSNPLLKSPDVIRLRRLADEHGFLIVIDETIGNFLNLNILPYADILVSSLTKLFSGDGNVMGGSLVLNPRGKHAEELQRKLATEYEDNYWIEDAVVLERNSRDFVSRNRRINENAELLCELFVKKGDKVKDIFYPRLHSTRQNYDRHKVKDGGYGGLLSVVFHSRDQAVEFYDALEASKGPSLGTNFTLASPYTLLAHYNELDWARQYGVESHLVRISVGLEEASNLINRFTHALDAIKS